MADSAFSGRIVQNLLDTDFYKLTMMQAVLHNYPNAEVEWEFRCRNDEDLTPYLAEIRYQIEQLADISITADQLAFLERIPFIKPDFTRFLSLFRFNLRYLQLGIEDGQLCVRLRGPWLHVILFEIPLLAVISEVRNRYRYRDIKLIQAREQLYRKFDWLRANASDEELAGFQLADFGTRRRFSYRVQDEVVHILKRDFPGRFVGTSNVHLAREYDIKPIGTMAHEWLMAHQQLGPRLIDSQIAALDCWVREYRGLLGIALTDCITMQAFLNDFDLYFAKLFDTRELRPWTRNCELASHGHEEWRKRPRMSVRVLAAAPIHSRHATETRSAAAQWLFSLREFRHLRLYLRHCRVHKRLISHRLTGPARHRLASSLGCSLGGSSVVVAEPRDGESHTTTESKKPANAGFFRCGVTANRRLRMELLHLL